MFWEFETLSVKNPGRYHLMQSLLKQGCWLRTTLINEGIQSDYLRKCTLTWEKIIYYDYIGNLDKSDFLWLFLKWSQEEISKWFWRKRAKLSKPNGPKIIQHLQTWLSKKMNVAYLLYTKLCIGTNLFGLIFFCSVN